MSLLLIGLFEEFTELLGLCRQDPGQLQLSITEDCFDLAREARVLDSVAVDLRLGLGLCGKSRGNDLLQGVKTNNVLDGTDELFEPGPRRRISGTLTDFAPGRGFRKRCSDPDGSR
ncbi:MAG: hypothetical protein ACI8QS_002339 [Planctomycetota bacterium]|jgi:hypothetical protein